MKKLKFLSVVALVVLLLAACAQKPEEKTSEVKNDQGSISTEKTEAEEFKPITITDAAGREVTFDEEVEKVACIGQGALRLYVYVNGSDKLVGIEDIEKRDEKPKKPYLIAHPELMELETIGQGGPKTAPDIEKLSYAHPDVIFSLYEFGKDDLDQLQEQTGSKVVGLSMGSESVFAEETDESILNIGKIMNKEEKAQEIIDYMKNIQKDLNERSGKVEDSPEVYIGGIGFRGSQGILSTRSNFNLLTNINADNVMDSITDERNIMIDKEKLLELDPEVIFMDLDGEAILKEDYKEDPGFYQNLSAFKNNTAYALIPYNNYQTNLETAMIDMYYMGSIIHPEGFKDVDIEKIAEEIYTELLGKDCLSDMLELYPNSLKPLDMEK